MPTNTETLSYWKLCMPDGESDLQIDQQRYVYLQGHGGLTDGKVVRLVADEEGFSIGVYIEVVDGFGFACEYFVPFAHLGITVGGPYEKELRKKGMWQEGR